MLIFFFCKNCSKGVCAMDMVAGGGALKKDSFFFIFFETVKVCMCKVFVFCLLYYVAAAV